ncbi:outer membrane lipoprotein-sorting protein [Massilia sp. W12]|uniref:outer membrane lipoprotein-sorting protein n=1 Tax=Massilia sp. W12 TaxID=3126507 RepID=UPI0030CF720A
MKFLSPSLLAAVCLLAQPAYAAMDVKEVQRLLTEIESTNFPEYSVSNFNLSHYKKDQVIKNFTFEMSLKDDKSLLAMQWPATSKHKYLLKSGLNLWMYFSDVRRSIRLSARDSFMGTDANNYDVMQTNLLKDYNMTSFSEVQLDGENVLKVELAAKPNTEGYAKLISYISPKEKRLIKNECYSISGSMIKTVQFKGIQEVGKFRIPRSVLITSMVNKDRSTLMEILKVTPKKADELKDSMFTLGYLETVE